MDVLGFLLVLLELAVLGIVLWWARQPVTDDDVGAWAARRGVTLTGADEDAVQAYLERSRRWRRAGAVTPFAIWFSGAVLGSNVWSSVTDTALPFEWPLWFALLGSPLVWAAGYVLGALAAELLWRRPQGDAVRRAAASERRVAQYVPAWVRWWVRVVPVLAVAFSAVVALAPPALYAREPRATGPAFAVAAAVVVLAFAVELGMRYVVVRPQRVASTHEAAVDDAIRSTAAHALAGVGVAVLAWLLSDLLRQVSDAVRPYADGGGIRWIYLTNGLGIAQFVLVAGGVLAWRSLAGPRAWTVRRVLDRQPVRP